MYVKDTRRKFSALVTREKREREKRDGFSQRREGNKDDERCERE